MSTNELIYDVADGIATLTLNRPDKLNAWTGEMGTAVRAAMEAAEADEQCSRHYSHRRRTRILRRRGHVAAE